MRTIKRAQILLAADAHSTDDLIARTVGVGTSTVYRTKQLSSRKAWPQRSANCPVPARRASSARAMKPSWSPSRAPSPPSGARWTMDLLAGEMVRLTAHETLSGDTVGRRLAEMKLKPWREKMWCIPTVNAEYVARMEDVLDLYAAAPDPRRPVVCFDETPRQLIGEARVPIRAEPGKARRVDYEYVRNGTANVFMFVDVNPLVPGERGEVLVGDSILPLPLLDGHQINAFRLDEALDGLHEPLAEGRHNHGRRDAGPEVGQHEVHDPAARLQRRHVRVEIHPVHRFQFERHVVIEDLSNAFAYHGDGARGGLTAQRRV